MENLKLFWEIKMEAGKFDVYVECLFLLNLTEMFIELQCDLAPHILVNLAWLIKYFVGQKFSITRYWRVYKTVPPKTCWLLQLLGDERYLPWMEVIGDCNLGQWEGYFWDQLKLLPRLQWVGSGIWRTNASKYYIFNIYHAEGYCRSTSYLIANFNILDKEGDWGMRFSLL